MEKKGTRPRLTQLQSKLLSVVYQKNPRPSNELRRKIASDFSIPARTVQIWFQNRRAKEKRYKTQSAALEPLSTPPRAQEEQEDGISPAVPFSGSSSVSSYDDYFSMFLEENYEAMF